MDTARIRNFCIIAHIDHGKSTLADRILELTGTVSPRDMTEQFMDQMDLERERGITIKGKAVRMNYRGRDGDYQLNLIDTPGHVDFGYEVSRALAACEGAILVVDATQGIQAQTLANVYLALEHDIEIIPVVNKIDLPVAQPRRVATEMEQAFGFTEDEILHVSAKDGAGVEQLLETIVERVPPPAGLPTPLRALVFDSSYDPYKGVVAYVRLFDGAIAKGNELLMMSTGSRGDILEVGSFTPRLTQSDQLSAGQVGYVATGLKNVRECRVGDTITLAQRPASQPLPGYQPLKPMVFAGLYPADGDEYLALRTSLEKLQLNDAALSYEPENSAALGFGFRCGFLGLLHMEIVQERLEREYDLNLLITAPSVAYQVLLDDGEEVTVDSPAKLPPVQRLVEMREPMLDMSIVTPSRYIGAIMDLVTTRRGEFRRMEYLQAVTSSGDGRPVDGRPRAAGVPRTSVGGAHGLLRPAQVTHPGLRVDGLLLPGLPACPTGQAGPACEQPARRRPFADCPPRQSTAARPGAGREAANADSAAAVRGADSGRHRQPGHRPRDGASAAQERAGQVLRRRRDAQAEAAGEAGGGQEADEARGETWRSRRRRFSRCSSWTAEERPRSPYRPVTSSTE